MITLDEAIKHCEEVAEEKEREAEYRQETQGDMFKFLDDLSKSVGGEGVENDALNDCLKCAEEHIQLAEWLRELKQFKEQESCEDVMAIHTQGLAEGIRCAMCTNSIKSDRGCDGGCIVDEDMYKNVVDTIRNHIVPPATPKRKVGEWIKKNNDYFDWYECSECGYGSDGEMKYNRLCDVRTKFCPDCGSQNLKGE